MADAASRLSVIDAAIGARDTKRGVVARGSSDEPAEATDEAPVGVTLLGGFGLTWGSEPVSLHMNSQRLAAFLAINARSLPRSYVAEQLWMDSSQERAAGSLRSAVWRLRQLPFAVLQTSATHLSLDPRVKTDFHDAARIARAIVDGSEAFTSGEVVARLTLDLLPDWYEDWITAEREQFRQLRLHALESLSRSLIGRGSFAHAVEAGLAAIAGEPLRETAHRSLIEAHLAEGNVGEAVRQYHTYRRLLRDEIGADPSMNLQEMMLQHLDPGGVPRREIVVQADSWDV